MLFGTKILFWLKSVQDFRFDCCTHVESRFLLIFFVNVLNELLRFSFLPNITQNLLNILGFYGSCFQLVYFCS